MATSPSIVLFQELAAHMRQRWLDVDMMDDNLFRCAVLVEALHARGIPAQQHRATWSHPDGQGLGQGYEIVHDLVIDGVALDPYGAVGDLAIVAQQASPYAAKSWKRASSEDMHNVIAQYTTGSLTVAMEAEVAAAVAFLDALVLSQQTPAPVRSGSTAPRL